MIPKVFAYSAQAHYAHSMALIVKTVNIINQNIVVTSDGKSFPVSLPDVSEKYTLPYVESDALVQRWRTDWMSFWQNQLMICRFPLPLGVYEGLRFVIVALPGLLPFFCYLVCNDWMWS